MTDDRLIKLQGSDPVNARYLYRARVPSAYAMDATDTTPAVADADERELNARRERYAAALARLDDWEWPTEYAGQNRSYREYADAAMAVADEENASLRAELEFRKSEQRRAFARLGWTYDGNDDV